VDEKINEQSSDTLGVKESLPTYRARNNYPASFYKLTDSVHTNLASDYKFYFSLRGSYDLGFKPTYGLGLSFGKRWKDFLFGFSSDFFKTTYASIKVHLTDADQNPPENRYEIARVRNDGDQGLLWLVGPEVGYMFKVFSLKNFLETAKFRFGYANFKDLSNNINFTGYFLNMTGSVSYSLERFVFGPSFNWNLIVLSRHPQFNELKSMDYLSLQLWSISLDFSFLF